MRIAMGGISHETSSFAKKPTTLADFASGFGLYRGDEILHRFRRSNMCAGGFLDGADKHSFQAIPLLWGFAYPSGLIVREDYESLKSEFFARLREEESRNGPVDGVLLDMHGAMVVEGIDDGDGDFIAAVRDHVGPKCPIVMTQDLHANHTQKRVDAADAIIGFDTYPHVDMAERGREAADLIVATIRGEVQPVSAFRSLPLFWGTTQQVTAHPPMNEVIERVHELESRTGMLSMTVSTGFPWADVPHVGASVIAVADGNQELAEQSAVELADWIWEHRARWKSPTLSVRDALRQGDAAGRYPIVLADQADNTGGGSPGDSTEVLQTFLDLGLNDAVVLYVVDPEAVSAAHAAGTGAMLDLLVGGKSDPMQGPPVPMQAEVMAISDGDFVYDGPMYAGLTGNMGPSAWLRQAGVSVIVVTAQEQPLGPAFARTLGIDCEKMKYIAVKSSAHFRASFEPFAGTILNVDAQAIHTHDFARLPYRRRTRPVFPIEIDGP